MNYKPITLLILTLLTLTLPSIATNPNSPLGGWGTSSTATNPNSPFGGWGAWRFHYGDIADGASPNLDDSQWSIVTLPHDFQISLPWVAPSANEKADSKDAGSNKASRLSARGFKEMGTGWYRCSFTPDTAWQNKRVLIDFEGIMYVGDVYLNGVRVGGTDYGYVGFEIDLTDRLLYGQQNVIAVKASTMDAGDSRWYTGGGLFRDVHLKITDKEYYFNRHPLKITPTLEGGQWKVAISAEITCRKKTDSLTVLTSIIPPSIDKGKNENSVTPSRLPYYPRARTNIYSLDTIVIDNPQLWDCEHPNLYKVVVSLLDDKGNVRDVTEEEFGLRTLEYSPQFGLKLNGKKVLLKGIANHHSLGALGAAAYPRAIEKRLRLLKEYGFNHLRTSHNPYSEDVLRLCDRLGILVVDELYDKWLKHFAGGRREWSELWQNDVPEFVKRDRNHPCVVMWSLGNELQQYSSLPFGDWGVTPYRLQRELLRQYDTTRPVTVAMHPRYRSLATDSVPAPLVFETDIASYNYRYRYFPVDSRRWPNLIFYQSEASMADMGPNFFGMDRDKVVGLAYWGMIDYLGESQGWPAKGWTHGAFDISLEPKPQAYLIKSMFKPEEPIIHIGILSSPTGGGREGASWNGIQTSHDAVVDHWNFPDSTVLNIFTYTNAHHVELLVNGRSMGVQVNDTTDASKRNRIRWDGIPYMKGKAEAVAYDEKDNVVARHTIHTTLPASRLAMTADNPQWKADGKDLQHIRITALDKNGRQAVTATDLLHFDVSGPAEIVGVVNGDITSNESMTGNERSLYNGTCTVILRSKKEKGKVTLTARGGKLSCSLTQTTKQLNN